MSDERTFYVKVAPIDPLIPAAIQKHVSTIETLINGNGKVTVKYNEKKKLLTLEVSKTTQYDIHHELIRMAGIALRGKQHTKFQTNAPSLPRSSSR